MHDLSETWWEKSQDSLHTRDACRSCWEFRKTKEHSNLPREGLDHTLGPRGRGKKCRQYCRRWERHRKNRNKLTSLFIAVFLFHCQKKQELLKYFGGKMVSTTGIWLWIKPHDSLLLISYLAIVELNYWHFYVIFIPYNYVNPILCPNRIIDELYWTIHKDNGECKYNKTNPCAKIIINISIVQEIIL